MTITADMTFGEIALLPEFAGFGEHLMLCRPSTWERMWDKSIAAHLNSDTNPYEVARVLRGLNRLIELADDGRHVAYDIWDEADCIRDPTRRNTKLFFFPGRPGRHSLSRFRVGATRAFVTKWKVFRLHQNSTMRAITYLCCHTG